MHVTQGTAANNDYAQVIAPTLEALAGEDVLVAVTTGGRPLDTLPPLPANARAAKSTCHMTNCCPAPTFSSPTAGTAESNTPCATGYRSPPPAARRTNPKWARAWHGPVPVCACGLSGRLPKHLRRAILAVLREPRYRQAPNASPLKCAHPAGSPPSSTSSTSTSAHLVTLPRRLSQHPPARSSRSCSASNAMPNRA
jgi:hypothetical protein